MNKLITVLSLLPSLAFAQAASTEVPIEPTAGAGAVIAFGVLVLVGIVVFFVVMSKANARKEGKEASGSK